MIVDGMDAVDLRELPTLSKGQCCDLKIEELTRRVWLCRGDDQSISVEVRINGRWVLKEDHSWLRSK